MPQRREAKEQYNEKLIERYKEVPEIKRIARCAQSEPRITQQRHTPNSRQALPAEGGRKPA